MAAEQVGRQREDYRKDSAEGAVAAQAVAQPFPEGRIPRPAFEKVRNLKERAEPAPVMQNMPKDVENLKDQLVFFAKRAKAKALPASGAQSC